MRKLAISIISIILISAAGNAQDIKFSIPPTSKEISKADKYIKKYAPSDSALKIVNDLATICNITGNYALARWFLDSYKKLFPRNQKYFERQIRFHTAIMLYNSPNETTLPVYDSFVREAAPAEDAFVAVQRIAEEYILSRKWDSAVTVFEEYKPLFPEMKDSFETVIDILEAPEEGLHIRNLSPLINSPRNEWDPNLTPDGKRLYFSADSRPGGNGRDDVWYSELKDGKWSKPVNLGKNINGPMDETIDNVSVDGNGLYLSGDLKGTFGKFDIFYAEKTKDGWSKIKHFPAPINTEYVDEAANLTPDGNALIFASTRPGGIGEYVPHGQPHHGTAMGNMDIYISFRADTGWSEPVNLGENINTPYAERAPYLHPDGKTLYFSSDGHPGLGRLDVFKSVRLNEDSWTEWSEPVNLGKEINSATDDWGYNFSIHGDSALFAALDRAGGYGGWDLYSVSLPEKAHAGPVITVSGKITDINGNPLRAKIIWEDLETGKKAGELTSDPEDGSYFIALPTGKNYGYYAELEGYYPASRNVDLRRIKAEPDIEENIILVSAKDMIENQEKIRVNNIFFDFDEFSLKKESFPELKRLARFLKRNPGFRVRIDGHTDNIGTKEYNKELSVRRAESVAGYLVEQGLPEGRFIVKGFGATKPVADNITNYGKSKNRRVEVWFVK